MPHYGAIGFLYLSTRVERLSRGKPHMYALQTYYFSHLMCIKLASILQGFLGVTGNGIPFACRERKTLGMYETAGDVIRTT